MNTTRVSKPVYRTACRADLERIMDIEAAVFPDAPQFYMLRQFFDMHGSDWLIAESDGEVIGYALIMAKGTRALLSTFAVVEGLRDRGIGHELLTRAMRHCRRNGVDTMHLTVRPGNARAEKMFKEAGFAVTEYDERYFGPGVPRYVMECPLRTGGA